MAKIGTQPPANLYDGLAIGAGVYYSFETQSGLPVDGSNAASRNASPFTLRLIIPDAISTAAGLTPAAVRRRPTPESASSTVSEMARNTGQFARASRQADVRREYAALRESVARVVPVDAPAQQLQSVISQAQYLSGVDARVASAIATAASAADIALQVQRMLEVPPLTLLINPAEMSITYTNLQTYSTRTRTGYVFERWGLEQPTISFSGSTGGFIAGVGNAPGRNPFASRVERETATVSGLQPAAMRDSAAWQNFMSLYLIYRNNGYIYDTLGNTEAHHMVGAVAIDYDQWTYTGHISSFTYTFDSESPHRVQWSMEFVVDRMDDNSTASTVVGPWLNAPTPTPGDPVYSIRQRPPNNVGVASPVVSRSGSNEIGGAVPAERTTSDNLTGGALFEMSQLPFNFTG